MKPFGMISAVLASMVIAATVCSQSGLDAPGEKKITVGSEIRRGFVDMFQRLSNANRPYLSELHEMALAITVRNEHNQANQPRRKAHC